MLSNRAISSGNNKTGDKNINRKQQQQHQQKRKIHTQTPALYWEDTLEEKTKDMTIDANV